MMLDKITYMGISILDLSKRLMYAFNFNYIKEKYGCKTKLLFRDTRSLTYEIATNDMYKDFYKDNDKFDFSNNKENSKFYTKTNKKIIGKTKDETEGFPSA